MRVDLLCTATNESRYGRLNSTGDDVAQPTSFPNGRRARPTACVAKVAKEEGAGSQREDWGEWEASVRRADGCLGVGDVGGLVSAMNAA